MKIRIGLVFVSLFATILVLFGAYFIFTNQTIERPVQDYFLSMEDVELKDLRVSKNELLVRIDVDNEFKGKSFINKYRVMEKELKELAADREVKIEFKQENEELLEMWRKEYFHVAEAVQTYHYSQIPTLVEHWMEKYKLSIVDVEMDSEHVYIYVQKDGYHLFKVVSLASEVNKV